MIVSDSHYTTTFQSVDITLSKPDFTPPFDIDAFVEEQDTYLIMDIEPVMRDTNESYNSLINKMIEQQPRKPGDIVIMKTRPLRFLAIIHDTERRPSYKVEWVEKALINLFNEAEVHQVNNIGMPMLGTIHGSLGEKDFIRLFHSALSTARSKYLEKIWLIVADINRIKNYLNTYTQ